MAKIVPVHFGEIKNCKLVLQNIDKWRSWLMQMNDKKVRVVIEDDKDNRSSSQNRFYWLYLNLVENEIGTTANDLHEIFKRKFLPPRFVKFSGREVKLPATTTKLDKLEFAEYLDKISALTEVPIPNPEEIDKV